MAMVKDKNLLFLLKNYTMNGEDARWSGGKVPHILNLDTRQM